MRTKKIISLFLALLTVISLAAIRAPSAKAATATMTNLVVFAKFADDEEDVFNKPGHWKEVRDMYLDNRASNKKYGADIDDSFRNFIKTISDGQLTVDVLFPQENAEHTAVSVFTLAGTKNSYGDNDWAVVREVIAAINAGTIALPDGYTPDHAESGLLDNMTVIIQGDASGSIESDPVIYPHKYNYPGVEKITAGGWNCQVGNYNIIDSGSVFNGTRAQGVLSHEFLHTVGMGDLYRYSGTGSPVGSWDIMSSAGRFQFYPLAYTRSLMGWLELDTVTPSGGASQNITLDLATLPSGNRGCIIRSPMSDSEFFVIEYRKKLTSGTGLQYGFDTKLQDEGLLIYRINTAVEGSSNQTGEDFLYVFRPGEIGLTASAGNIGKAAVTPWFVKGAYDAPDEPAVTSYGSADMEADFTSGTLFYSDGQNSGITITDISAGENGRASDQLTLTVNFPDYEAMELWEKADVAAIQGCVSCNTATSPDGTVYVASDPGGSISVGRLDGGKYTALPSPGNGAAPKIAFLGSTPVVLYTSSDMTTVYLKAYENGQWAQKAALQTNQQYTCISGGTDTLYFGYLPNAGTLEVNTLTASGIGSPVSASEGADSTIYDPAIAVLNGVPYIAYGCMDAHWKFSNTKIVKIENNTFSEPLFAGLHPHTSNRAAVGNGKLYILSSGGASVPSYIPTLYTFDGKTWTAESPIDRTDYVDASLTAGGGSVFISLVKNTGNTEAQVYRIAADGVCRSFYGSVTKNVSDAALIYSGGYVYSPIISSLDSGSLQVYRHALPDYFGVTRTEQGAQADILSLEEISGKAVTAFYDADGKMLYASLSPLELKAGESKTITVPYAQSGRAAEIKTFLISAEGKPLSEPAVWRV